MRLRDKCDMHPTSAICIKHHLHVIATQEMNIVPLSKRHEERKHRRCIWASINVVTEKDHLVTFQIRLHLLPN